MSTKEEKKDERHRRSKFLKIIIKLLDGYNLKAQKMKKKKIKR